MAGNDDAAALTAYLTRLTGEPVAADQPVQLRSVHRAALISWARGRGLTLHTDGLNAGQIIRVQDLLAHSDATPASSTAVSIPTPLHAAPASATASLGGIGIDIEDIAALPEASDYRAHPFFQDHFSPTEIAYCVRQGNVRASFCGTWAAKEAIAKSGILPAIPNTLNAIPVDRDAAGRPLFPGCTLSISHTAATAVAVCVAFVPAPTAALREPPALPLAPVAMRAPSTARALTAALGLIVVVQACCLVFLVWR